MRYRRVGCRSTWLKQYCLHQVHPQIFKLWLQKVAYHCNIRHSEFAVTPALCVCTKKKEGRHLSDVVTKEIILIMKLGT